MVLTPDDIKALKEIFATKDDLKTLKEVFATKRLSQN